MTISNYFAFIAYACVTTFAPGPNNILLLSSAGQHGFKKCLPLMAGIWSGLITVMLLAGSFCSGLGNILPSITPTFKIFGSAYILYLAWKTWKSKPLELSPTIQNKPLTFINGFLLQFLNIKVIMLGLASYPTYFLNESGKSAMVVLFAVSMTLCCGTGNLIWATLGSLLFPFYKKWYKWINSIMAVLLLGCVWKVIR